MIEIGDKVTTQAHEHLALDYHDLEGFVGDKKKDIVFYGTRRVSAVFCWVNFCGPEWERRNAMPEFQSGRRLCKGLWMQEAALIKQPTRA